MTNEEAIKVLKIAIEDSKEQNIFCFSKKGIEALEMARKLLESQPCEDAISREEVLRHRHVVQNDDWIGCCVVRVNEITKLPSVTPSYNSVKTELEQTRWTPVSERLPEEQRTIGKYIFSENVLGTEGYTIRRAYYNYTTKEWFDGNEETEWSEITHWMPLPEEPYMAESQE